MLGTRKPLEIIYYILTSVQKKWNGTSFSHHIAIKGCKTKTWKKTEIFSVNIFLTIHRELFLLAFVFQIFTMHTCTQIFFFLSVCKFCACSFADLHVCLIFALQLTWIDPHICTMSFLKLNLSVMFKCKEKLALHNSPFHTCKHTNTFF